MCSAGCSAGPPATASCWASTTPSSMRCELRERQDYITKVIRTEEENFARTIDGGLKIFNDMLEQHKAKGEKIFSGADAFKLYDTYGFPIDLTMEMVAEQGMAVDEKGFQKLMQEQKERARKAREALGDLGWAGVEFGKDVPETEFVGYDNTAIDGARVVALVVENEQAEELMPGVEGIVVLDKTPFYAEMGGQVGDHGVLTAPNGGVFQVTDVQKNKGGKYMHYGKMSGGVLKLGDTVKAEIDVPRRKAIMRSHSATHLLDAVLRKVLGDHVHQAGSLVEPDKLRFDFTHFAALTAEELSQVSAQVNEAGGAPSPCSARSTATPSGWWTWARASLWSSAAAPTWTTPPRWACSTSTASSPWPPASAASRPPPASSPWRL